MDFLDLAKQRYSVRSFDGKRIPEEDVGKIIEAGLTAPTAHNNQPVRIMAIRSEDAMAKFRKCTVCHYDAPLAFIVCYDENESWKREYDGKDSGYVDASIVTTFMMMEAQSLGIGSTWVMYFIPDAVRTEFALPDHVEPVACIVMGYPAKDAKPSPSHDKKKRKDEIVTIL